MTDQLRADYFRFRQSGVTAIVAWRYAKLIELALLKPLFLKHFETTLGKRVDFAQDARQ